MKEQLGRVDTHPLALDQERRESRGRLEAQLRTLSETGERLRTETGALVTALRKPNTRGEWGQMQLRNVVEPSGMVRHCDFVEQSSLPGDESTLRPDLIVSMPGGKHVVVDAKAPLQAVLDAYEARDEAERERPCATTRGCCESTSGSLRTSSTGRGWTRGPDFVVMFLPGEHLYGAALETDPSLLEDAMAQRVADRDPDDLAGAAALGRLRLAAGARGRVRPGGVGARPRAARQAGEAVGAVVDGRHPAQRRGPRLQRGDRFLRAPGAPARGGSPITESSPSPHRICPSWSA